MNIKKINAKIKEHGLKGSFRILYERLPLFWNVYAPWPLRITFYKNLFKLIFTPHFRKKRILGIWDYKALPWSVGDPLVFIEVLSVLKLKYKAEDIDICVIYDRDDPAGNRGGEKHKNSITLNNAQYHLFEFLPLFKTCPYLGSVYQFNSRKEFHYFLKNNIERYNFYPPLSKHLSESYNYWAGASDVHYIQDFYKDYGYIPHLSINERDEAWARWFYINHMPRDRFPIVLSLRSSVNSQNRNADPKVWLAFINKCKQYFPEVVFVIVGLREEIFEGFRNQSNIIIAKDFGTSVMEDMALIRASFMYMATNSGVNTIAWFSDLPYLIFQWPVYTLSKYGLKSDENFNFASEKQKIFSTETAVTPDLLFSEFEKLYSTLDQKEWMNKTYPSNP